ncbi:sensor domain-containing diguanylate cyclase [Stutzerimonas stutzeri]|uniref:diguanylate cyclase n=1 Tax=Stutzerimonas stutzeri RCH2 TaxID=644801 RepID=L0GDI6_STUST|nr:diguanylate cyclase [Stutzerimonas stutzeri]AGA84813.1 diguanylate cyclase (GGDEF) domain-containing protein [Stutzerimonas stutzeri RCH2]
MIRTFLLLLACLTTLPWIASVSAAPQTSVLQTRTEAALQVGVVEYLLGEPAADFVDIAAADLQWQALTKPNLGKQRDGAWLRFTLYNEGAEAKRWYLLLKWPVLDRVAVRLHYPDSDRWGQPMLAGDALALSVRPLADHHFVYPLELPAGEPVVVYMQLQAREILALPLELIDDKQLIEGKLRDVTLVSLFFGGILVIVLYNCSLLIFTRDRSYFLYVLYLLSAVFYVLTITGFGQLYLWPEIPELSARFYGLSAALCFFTPMLFALRFLGIRRYGGWVWAVSITLTCYWGLVALTILLAPTLARYLFMESVALLHCVLTMAVTLNLWARGNQSARLFSIAWSTLLGFTVINLLALNGTLPLNAWTLNGQLIGMFTEFVLLSMALAERINVERNRRIAAQQLALQASETLAEERALHLQAKQEALDLQLHTNEVLEARVYERTRALEEVRQGLEAANAELTRLSTTDALTQLANRRRFDRLLDEEIRRARRSGSPLSVLLADIDHFKRVNDGYGHPFGDECLRQVAAVLAAHCQRAGDLAARYGGEEFVVLLPASDQRQAFVLAERIRQNIERLQLRYGDQAVALTISLGVATLGPTVASAEALLATADAALYAAKHAGRNQVVCAPEAAIGETGAGVSPQPV